MNVIMTPLGIINCKTVSFSTRKFWHGIGYFKESMEHVTFFLKVPRYIDYYSVFKVLKGKSKEKHIKLTTFLFYPESFFGDYIHHSWAVSFIPWPVWVGEHMQISLHLVITADHRICLEINAVH